MEMVWVTMNLDDGNRLAYAGPSKATACRVAAALVGNNAAGHTGSDIVLYGPGNGTTSVMVRQLPKGCIGPPTWNKLLAACKAVYNDLHERDGGWSAGADCQVWEEDGTLYLECKVHDRVLIYLAIRLERLADHDNVEQQESQP
jgi:hypothetical protein